MGQSVSSVLKPVGKIAGSIKPVKKFVGGVSKGISKFNKSTGGMLGKSWDIVKEQAPLISTMGPYGRGAAAAIEGGRQVEDVSKEITRKRSSNFSIDMERGRARIY